MQGQPPRLEGHKLREFQAGEITHFSGVGNGREDVFRSEDRAIVAQVRWNLRLNPRIPRAELRIGRVCGQSHRQYSCGEHYLCCRFSRTGFMRISVSIQSLVYAAGSR